VENITMTLQIYLNIHAFFYETLLLFVGFRTTQ